MYIHKITIERPNPKMRRFLRKFETPHQDELMRDTLSKRGGNIVITTPSPFFTCVLQEKAAEYGVSAIVETFEEESAVRVQEAHSYGHLYE